MRLGVGILRPGQSRSMSMSSECLRERERTSPKQARNWSTNSTAIMLVSSSKTPRVVRRRWVEAEVITGAQIKAAQKLLGWSRDRLAPMACMSITALNKIEEGSSALSTQVDGLQRALESAGVEFTEDDEPGVKLTAKGERAK